LRPIAFIGFSIISNKIFHIIPINKEESATMGLMSIGFKGKLYNMQAKEVRIATESSKLEKRMSVDYLFSCLESNFYHINMCSLYYNQKISTVKAILRVRSQKDTEHIIKVNNISIKYFSYLLADPLITAGLYRLVVCHDVFIHKNIRDNYLNICSHYGNKMMPKQFMFCPFDNKESQLTFHDTYVLQIDKNETRNGVLFEKSEDNTRAISHLGKYKGVYPKTIFDFLTKYINNTMRTLSHDFGESEKLSLKFIQMIHACGTYMMEFMLHMQTDKDSLEDKVLRAIELIDQKSRHSVRYIGKKNKYQDLHAYINFVLVVSSETRE
jgi:hypothetical protein